MKSPRGNLAWKRLHVGIVCQHGSGVHYSNLFLRVNVPQYLFCPVDSVFYHQALMNGIDSTKKGWQCPSEVIMNWDQVEGKWKQYKGQAKEKWGKLTDDDLDVIEGRRQQLVGRIQERYGIAKDVAEQQADEFVKTLKAEDREERKAHRAGRS
jgi:uncharacterized protein YjbJ (UPF0337 family)